MTPRSSTALIYDPRFREHNAELEHIESPERLTAVWERLQTEGILTQLRLLSPRPATREEAAAVHNESLLSAISWKARSGGGFLDPDTYVSPRSEEIAYLAAGAVLTALDQVFEGKIANAFCLVRPPGHHATSTHGRGFCLLNNLAIGASYVLSKKSVSRILILDWDAHHGNGIQDIFYDNNKVLYISLHQSPHYPGTGAEEEIGKGAGEGYTVNIPFPPYTAGDCYRMAFEQIITPISEQFKPELILVAAGFDGHYADPLSSLRLTAPDFSAMTVDLMRLADRWAGGRLVMALEGGYNLKSLACSVAETVARLSGANTFLKDPGENISAQTLVIEKAQAVLDQVRIVQSRFWSV